MPYRSQCRSNGGGFRSGCGGIKRTRPPNADRVDIGFGLVRRHGWTRPRRRRRCRRRRGCKHRRRRWRVRRLRWSGRGWRREWWLKLRHSFVPGGADARYLHSTSRRRGRRQRGRSRSGWSSWWCLRRSHSCGRRMRRRARRQRWRRCGRRWRRGRRLHCDWLRRNQAHSHGRQCERRKRRHSRRWRHGRSWQRRPFRGGRDESRYAGTAVVLGLSGKCLSRHIDVESSTAYP